MATVKEVKLMKDGAMVTPVVLADSVKNLDGTKYKDSVNNSLNSINSSISSLNTSVSKKIDVPTTSNITQFPVGTMVICNMGEVYATGHTFTMCSGSNKYFHDTANVSSTLENRIDIDGTWMVLSYFISSNSYKLHLVQRIL